MPKRAAHHAVANGVSKAVTTTEVAISAVADGAIATYCGSRSGSGGGKAGGSDEASTVQNLYCE